MKDTQKLPDRLKRRGRQSSNPKRESEVGELLETV